MRAGRGRTASAFALAAGGITLAGVGLHGADVGAVLCPFRTLTGHDCPGCGSTRAIAALAKGDIADAVNYNALAVTAMVVLTASVSFGLATGNAPGALIREKVNALTVLALVAGFWALRLTPTPIGQYLASAPSP
ncbi:MAG: DUF2752 domain-containing protein [Acidimicrobiia bacterium]